MLIIKWHKEPLCAPVILWLQQLIIAACRCLLAAACFILFSPYFVIIVWGCSGSCSDNILLPSQIDSAAYCFSSLCLTWLRQTGRLCSCSCASLWFCCILAFFYLFFGFFLGHCSCFPVTNVFFSPLFRFCCNLCICFYVCMCVFMYWRP